MLTDESVPIASSDFLYITSSHQTTKIIPSQETTPSPDLLPQPSPHSPKQSPTSSRPPTCPIEGSEEGPPPYTPPVVSLAQQSLPPSTNLNSNLRHSVAGYPSHSQSSNDPFTNYPSSKYEFPTSFKSYQPPDYVTAISRSFSHPEGGETSANNAFQLTSSSSSSAFLPPYSAPPSARLPTPLRPTSLDSYPENYSSVASSVGTPSTSTSSTNTYRYPNYQRPDITKSNGESTDTSYHQNSTHITYPSRGSAHQSQDTTAISTSNPSTSQAQLSEDATGYQSSGHSAPADSKPKEGILQQEPSVKTKSPASSNQPMVHSKSTAKTQTSRYKEHQDLTVSTAVSSIARYSHEISFTSAKFHKKTASLFRNKNHSSKSPKSPLSSTSSPSSHSSANKKHKDKDHMRKNNMFHRLKNEGPTTYILPSKKDDSSKKSQNSPSTPLPVTFPDYTSTTHSNSSTSSSTSSSCSSHSSKQQLMLLQQHQQQQQQGLADLLTCPVCLEEYQTEGVGSREPLFLSCHHSICRACLPKLSKTNNGKYSSYAKEGNEISCPECRVVTQIPSTGLTQNFYLVSLLESRRKKAKEPSSRLRMWCRECNNIALETCTSHNVIHLSSILTNYVNTYTSTRRHVTKYLHKRAKHKGEEARDIKEAVEQLDLATSSLRRRLVAQLDYATLSQATANSLLQEVEQMCRRVGLNDGPDSPIGRPEKSSSPSSSTSESSASRKISTGGLGAAVMSTLMMESSTFREMRSEGTDSGCNSARGVDLLMFDTCSGYGKDGNSHHSHHHHHHHRRSHSKDESVSSPAGSRPPSSRNSPDLSRKISFDHMGSDEQEAKIMLLKECIKSMEHMEESLKQEDGVGKEKLIKSKSAGDNMPKETLTEMFSRAVNALT